MSSSLTGIGASLRIEGIGAAPHCVPHEVCVGAGRCGDDADAGKFHVETISYDAAANSGPIVCQSVRVRPPFWTGTMRAMPPAKALALDPALFAPPIRAG